MADLIIAAANLAVQASPAPTVNPGTSGEALTQGQLVFQSTGQGGQTAGQWYRASANTVNKKLAQGIVMTTVAAAGQQIMVMTVGVLSFGAILSLSTIYLASVNLGGIAPFADWAAGQDYIQVGYPLTTSNLLLNFQTPGFTHP